MVDVSKEVSNAFQFLHRLRRFSQLAGGLAPGNALAEDEAFLGYCFMHCHDAKSQIFQDLFVAHHLKERRNGFFVEFGATNGIDLSNTYLLEKKYQWHGILAEPARIWQESLRRNRSCVVDSRCVWERTGDELLFNETLIPELSTINLFSGSDGHAKTREQGQRYSVITVTLNDLLAENNAPRHIDYLSVDTEGSELNILRAFDFNHYDVDVITVEHNYTTTREPIHELLEGRGFRRKFEAISQWDDWYVRI